MGNSNPHGGKPVCMCFCRLGCRYMLLKVLKLCLQNEAEAKININLDKPRSIEEVIEEGIFVKI